MPCDWLVLLFRQKDTSWKEQKALTLPPLQKGQPGFDGTLGAVIK